jgi:sterol desaturase/sphingolipid hydroxylase (fatty acid hydroxylase superfamily)
VFELYSLAHDHQLFDLGTAWFDVTDPLFLPVWVALFLLEDLSFYAFHRASHRFSFLWAAHVTHHSSSLFNLSTSLRQSWTPFVALPFWIVLPFLGFDPLMVMSAQFTSLLYQAFTHTEVVPRLGPLEWIFNTPHHHRVHHGSNEAYVDKNFGGVLIIWDRLFGTYAELEEPVRYGLGDDAAQRNPVLVGVHGWLDLFAKKEQRT